MRDAGAYWWRRWEPIGNQSLSKKRITDCACSDPANGAHHLPGSSSFYEGVRPSKLLSAAMSVEDSTYLSYPIPALSLPLSVPSTGSLPSFSCRPTRTTRSSATTSSQVCIPLGIPELLVVVVPDLARCLNPQMHASSVGRRMGARW